ncbi:MAG TPA: hypothetical protein VN973_09560, partial [Candidatus Dormibacteraeota bacterium]|nr:hypothetical protein [Candidatus Dormibacteraeota bacterium]
MQLAGTTSWRMATDEPQSLLMALYVRDASGLRPQVDPDIPSLEPGVPFREKPSPVDRVASAQWADWWQHVLEGGGFWPDHLSPTDLPRITHDPQIQKLFYWPSRQLPPDFAGLSGAPELQALVRRHHEAARVWSEARKHEFVALTVMRQRVSLESEIVQTVERGLGRKARPFELDVRVLPVAAVQAWRLSPGRALVTRALFRDRAAYRDWLRPIIEELA